MSGHYCKPMGEDRPWTAEECSRCRPPPPAPEIATLRAALAAAEKERDEAHVLMEAEAEDRANAENLLAAALAAAEELGATNAKQADALAQRDATIRVMHEASVAAVRATAEERDAAQASERALRTALQEVAEALEIMARDMRMVIPDTKPIADVLDGIAGQARALLASPDAARSALPTPCEGHNHDPSDECGIHCPARSTAASSRPDRGDGNEG